VFEGTTIAVSNIFTKIFTSFCFIVDESSVSARLFKALLLYYRKEEEENIVK